MIYELKIVSKIELQVDSFQKSVGENTLSFFSALACELGKNESVFCAVAIKFFVRGLFLIKLFLRVAIRSCVVCCPWF